MLWLNPGVKFQTPSYMDIFFFLALLLTNSITFFNLIVKSNSQGFLTQSPSLPEYFHMSFPCLACLPLDCPEHVNSFLTSVHIHNTLWRLNTSAYHFNDFDLICNKIPDRNTTIYLFFGPGGL